MVITDIGSFILFFLLFVSLFPVNVHLMFYLARSSIDSPVISIYEQIKDIQNPFLSGRSMIKLSSKVLNIT